jgi:hypothetical protein
VGDEEGRSRGRYGGAQALAKLIDTYTTISVAVLWCAEDEP